MKVGIPDIIAFICIFTMAINATPTSALQYISVGLKSFKGNLSLILACYKQMHKNSTCTHIDETLQSDLSSLTMIVNIVKGILSTLFVYILGGMSDVMGRKFPIMWLLVMNIILCSMVLLNTLFVTSYPPEMYILQQGVVQSLCGGSAFSINWYIIAYLSITTPPDQQTSRFSVLLAVGFCGYVLGPILSGIIMGTPAHLYIIGIISCSLAVIDVFLCLFGLRNVQDEDITSQSNDDAASWIVKFGASITHQYQNTLDLFRNQLNTGKFIETVIMYMLTSVGLATPLIVISMVYVLGAPFSWNASFRSYFLSGLGITLALQSGLTVKILQYFGLTQSGIMRIGVLCGFIGSFILAFAKSTDILIIGVAVTSFIVISIPTIQSMSLSLVNMQQVGAAVGLLAAVQNIAEGGLVNVVLYVYKTTRKFMNGFCFLSMSLFLGIDLVMALFYRHPVTRADETPILENDNDTGSFCASDSYNSREIATA